MAEDSFVGNDDSPPRRIDKRKQTAMDRELEAFVRQCIETVRNGSRSNCDALVERIVAEGRRDVHEILLKGIRIDRSGTLLPTRPFIVHPYSQNKVDCFLWRLVLLAEGRMDLDPSLEKSAITRVCFQNHESTVYDARRPVGYEAFVLPEEMRHLPNLRRLMLPSVGLKAFPKPVLGMRNLEFLDLSGNLFLSNLPDAFYGLTNLKYLDLSHCEIRSVSPLIANMRELRVLKLASTRIRRLPEEFFLLEKLVRLDLGQMEMSDFHCPPGGLPGLRRLDLHHVSIDSTKKLRLPEGLTYLNISASYWESLPTQVTDLARLRYLVMKHNRLLEIPDSIGRLTRLRRLDLYNSRMFRISPEILTLKELRFVRLDPSFGRACVQVPEIHGTGIDGLRRLIAASQLLFDMTPTGDPAVDKLNPYFHFRKWRRYMYLESQVNFLRFQYRRRLFVSAPRMKSYLDEGATWDRVAKGVEIILAKRLDHFITALLYPYRILDGVLFRMPGLWRPFQVKGSILHAAALALIGRMDEEELQARLGEGRVRRIFDKVHGVYGFRGDFPHLEELSVECASGKVPEEIWTLPSLKGIDVYGASQPEVERLAGVTSLERLGIYQSHFPDTFCLKGHPSIREISMDIETGNPHLLFLDMKSLESLRLNLDEGMRNIVVDSCPRISSLVVREAPNAELFIGACPSLRTLDLMNVGDADLERIVGDSPRLESIHIIGVGIHIIPESIATLERIQSLVFKECSIERIPDFMSRLSSLRRLEVFNDNSFTTYEVDPEDLQVIRHLPLSLLRKSGLRLSLSLPDESYRRLLAHPGPFGLSRNLSESHP